MKQSLNSKHSKYDLSIYSSKESDDQLNTPFNETDNTTIQ